MYQVPPETWQELASQGRLRHPTWQKLMPLPVEKLLPALDSLVDEWEQEHPERAVRAALLVAPLLVERAAISAFLRSSPMGESLRPAMPELLTVEEAVAMADQEFRLSATEREALRKLLREHEATATS
jgi:hypothetical protein